MAIDNLVVILFLLYSDGRDNDGPDHNLNLAPEFFN